jgi:hypothetical protein
MAINNADANVTREFHIAERLNFEAMFQVFNLFNHIDLAGPNTSVTSNQFGWVPVPPEARTSLPPDYLCNRAGITSW